MRLSYPTNQFLSVIVICITQIFSANLIFAGEIDIEKADGLFQKMFGEEYNKVIATVPKTDDEKFALDLIASAGALNSNTELQTYTKYKAAEILYNSSKNKKQARDLLIEVNPDLPESLQKEISKKIFDLQKSILSSTPSNNKMQYTEEVQTFVSCAQALSYFYLLESDFTNSLSTLKEALNYLKVLDKDAATELNKKIMAIQKEANRFSQIQNTIKQLSTNPKDEKANQEVAEYYLFERNNLCMAWPYLDNLTLETYHHFVFNIKKCLGDEAKVTPDEIQVSLIPVLNYHTEYFLNWLSKKDIVDPDDIVKKQLESYKTTKKISHSKVKKVVFNTIEKNGEKQNTSYQIYLSLASNFDSFMEIMNQNKKLDAESLKIIKDQLITNKYIALMKANIKFAKEEGGAEVDKLKLEIDIGKIKGILKEKKIEEFPVDISTPFLFQSNDLLFDKIEVNGEGLYTFDNESYNQFTKDFEIFVNDKPYDTKDKSSLKALDGNLLFCDIKAGTPYMFKSKKRKWSANTEVSFEILKDYDPLKQSLDIFFSFKPEGIQYTKSFAIAYHFFLRGGWFGIIREGENFEAFTGSKLTKKWNPDNTLTSIWKTDRVKISGIFKDNKFEIFINGESFNSYPISEISQDKGFPNSTPIVFCFSKRGTPTPEVPIKIDNFYIGPPRPMKK